MRLAFVISSLGQGGAERVCVSLCNHWADTGHEVNIISFCHPDTASAYKLSGKIRWIKIGPDSAEPRKIARVWQTMRRVVQLRKTLTACSPDHVISFITETNIQSIVASFFRPWSITVSERIHPKSHPVGSFTKLARKFIYRFANAVVVQNQEIKVWVEKESKCSATIIENPIDLARFADLSVDNQMVPANTVVAAGRLEHQKGFDILIEAFAQVAEKFPDWQLKIFGEGSNRIALEQQVRKLDMKNRVDLPGASDQIEKILRSATLFVHSSRYEGLPNIVLEAMASGTAVIACNPHGSLSILEDNEACLKLLPKATVQGLSEAMATLMGNASLRARYGKLGPRKVIDMALPSISKKWVALFESMMLDA